MCEECGGRGIVIVNSELARRCDCMKIKAVKNKLRTAGIPGEKVFLDDYDLRYFSQDLQVTETNKTCYAAARDALNASRKMVQNPEDGIALVGPVGRGKTFMARCTAHELLKKGTDLIFIVVPDLLSEIKETYQDDSERTELQLLEAARKVKVLFLDDLGAHKYSEWVLSQLYSILNYRVNQKLPTFITSNMTITEMEDCLGERVTSRIIDLCAIHYLDSENDIRLMKRVKKLKGEKSA